MGVKLIVMNGKKKGMEVPVTGPMLFIGSAKACHLRLQGPLIGKYHCMIVINEQFMAVRDWGSKGGTRVNGTIVASEQQLKVGDRIKIGVLEFEIQLNVNGDVKEKPMIHSMKEAAARTDEPIDNQDLDLGSRQNNALNDTQDFYVTKPERRSSETTSEAVAKGPKRQSTKEEPKDKDKQKPVKVVGVCRNGHWKPTASTSADAATQALKRLLNRRRSIR